ncbi:hypothetical protein CEP17_09905 [Microbacterium sp. PM5]|nr:hypothetical protein CEP17_09905 [Microbacterium sp. PM5]
MDITASASRAADCMLAAWLVGTEHRSAPESGRSASSRSDLAVAATPSRHCPSCPRLAMTSETTRRSNTPSSSYSVLAASFWAMRWARRVARARW